MSPDESESPADTGIEAANQSLGVGYTGVRVSPTSLSQCPKTVKTLGGRGSSYLVAYKGSPGVFIGYVAAARIRK